MSASFENIGQSLQDCFEHKHLGSLSNNERLPPPVQLGAQLPLVCEFQKDLGLN